MGLPNGVHHLALNTGDIKAQVEYFTDVLGAELKALYWMHGATGVAHAFLKLNDLSYVAFVQTPDGVGPKPEGKVPAAASMNHVAFSVPTEQDLIRLRDRIRAKGLVAIGPIDHHFCQSLYTGGPEGLHVEIATNEVGIDERAWVDPEVARHFGMSEAELARYQSPLAAADEGGAVPQPALDLAKPHPQWPKAALEKYLSFSDTDVFGSLGNVDPPVKLDAELGAKAAE